jgi:hypothetical protein
VVCFTTSQQLAPGADNKMQCSASLLVDEVVGAMPPLSSTRKNEPFLYWLLMVWEVLNVPGAHAIP